MIKYAFSPMILCLAFLPAAETNAQIKKPGFTIGGSFMFSNPQGRFREAYNFGGGAEAFGGVGWGDTYIMGTAGFSVFKADLKTSGTLTYMPVKLGLRQFFLKKHLFINADLGVASVKNKLLNEGRFTRGFGAGARLFGLEVALYYDGWKNKDATGFSNFIDAKVGWNISL